MAYISSLAEYLAKVEGFMDTVAEVAVKIGFEEPMFHVFSESREPSLHRETSMFDELPS